MNVNTAELSELLVIEERRVQLNRMRQELQVLSSGTELRAKEEERIGVAGKLSNALQLMDELTTELKRAETDLEVVEARIEKDTQAISSTSSSKDAAGLQHELQTLAKRKSDLEDMQLELLERAENQRAEVDSLTTKRELLAGELAESKSALTAKINSLQAEILTQERLIDELGSRIAPELLDLYQKKSVRGIAVGRLVKLTCSACNMGLTSAAHKEISGTPIDEIVTCPECSAILVRDF